MKNNFTSIKAFCILLCMMPACQTIAQIIFRDDFTAVRLGVNWTTSSNSKWSVVAGKARNNYDGNGAVLETANDYAQTSYVLETVAFSLELGYFRQYSLLFGKPEAGKDYGYVLKYQPYYNQGLILGRSDGNEYSPTILAKKIMTLDSEAQIRFRIEKYTDGQIKVFLNSGDGYGSEPVLEATDKTFPALGHFGWRIDTETAAVPFYVDWIEARNMPSLLSNPVTSTDTPYQVGILSANCPVYNDRAYIFSSVPFSLGNAAFIQTGNNEKYNTSSSFLKFKLAQSSTVYVFYDPRGKTLPAWLSGWTKLPSLVYTTDPGIFYLNVYSKNFPAGTVSLGGNLAAPAKGALTNYLVAVKLADPDLRIASEDKELAEADISFTTFPNPAKSKVAMRYRLEEATAVKITLYDPQGKIASELVDEYQQAGLQEKNVDVSSFNNGLYIYRIRTDKKIQTGKLLINK